MKTVFVEIELPKDHGIGGTVSIQNYHTGIWYEHRIIAVHSEPAVRHHKWYVHSYRDRFVDQEIGG